MKFVALLVFIQLYQGSLGQDSKIQVSPKYIVANKGENITTMCKINEGIESCRFRVAGVAYFLKPGKAARDGVTYNGKGLDKGECGVMIENIQDKHNGNITCSVAGNSEDPIEYEANIQVVVAIAPQKPELTISVENVGRSDLQKEGDVLTALCTVRDSRPAANLSWFIGDEPLIVGTLIPVETCTAKDRKLCTIQQNITRTLKATDDRKNLRCHASHHALKGGELFAEYKISVTYAPKPSVKPVEVFGLVIGEKARVPVVIRSNPKPAVTWKIGGDHIYENGVSGRFTVESTIQRDSGEFESALLIQSLTKEDTERGYSVTAHNDLGEEHYTVSLSTSLEPKVLEINTNMIFIIIASLIIVVALVGFGLYSRAKGKFCFAAGNAEKRVASPSEGTENPAVTHHASSEYINNSPELKKEKPKEDTPV